MTKLTHMERYLKLESLSPDRLIFTGKQLGIDCENMDQRQAIQAIMDAQDREANGTNG
jgi:hypothetical protein